MKIDLVEYAEELELTLPANIEVADLYCREEEENAEPDVNYPGWTSLHLDVLQVGFCDGYVECWTWDEIQEKFGEAFLQIVLDAMSEKEELINA